MSVGLNPITVPNLEKQLEDLRQRGLDPGSSVICAPSAGTPGAIKGIGGCNQFHRCIFARREFGAFKGQGKRYVPYFVDARDGLNHATEMFMDCQRFMQLMVPRMRAGQESIESGLDGEQVEVLCENGKLAETVIMTGFVRIDPLKVEAGYHRTDTETPVPPYKYPQEMEHKAISKVRERRAARKARDPNSNDYVAPQEEPEVLDMTTTDSEPRKRAARTHSE